VGAIKHKQIVGAGESQDLYPVTVMAYIKPALPTRFNYAALLKYSQYCLYFTQYSYDRSVSSILLVYLQISV
jgi:hypothetical protein